MDYSKIGNFIMNERKAKQLTQAGLARLLFVSEKTISKWEKGRGLPDTNILPKLCEIFNISLNELLNGERFNQNSYIDKAESKLLELEKSKQDCDKRLLAMEIVIGVLAMTILLSFTFIASFLVIQVWLRIVLIVFGFVIAIIGILFAIRIEQMAGYFTGKISVTTLDIKIVSPIPVIACTR